MNKSIAMKWVRALRSGKYKQGRDYLKEGERYCCLGVLQERVLGLKTIKREFLTKHACRLAGMYGVQGEARIIQMGGEDYYSLADANDRGKKFSSIANWIEKHWEAL